MTPQERMKRRMQLALNRQCQANISISFIVIGVVKLTVSRTIHR